jgi:glycosyltransferase A (GT-A) superfamily protein (DUF2064 family)
LALVRLRLQSDAGGDRKAVALGTGLTVLLATKVGTDCPDITPELIENAFERLATADLVLGPATDGGYDLVGLRINQRVILGYYLGIPPEKLADWYSRRDRTAAA